LIAAFHSSRSPVFFAIRARNIAPTFAELQAVLDIFGAGLSGQATIARIKGLNLPQKGACSQANTFQRLF
jgi:hypothetical protein